MAIFDPLKSHDHFRPPTESTPLNRLKNCRGWLRRRPYSFAKLVAAAPPRCDNITRTHLVLTVHGVTFNNILSFSPHIKNVTAETNTTLYALKTRKVHMVCNERPCGKLHGQP